MRNGGKFAGVTGGRPNPEVTGHPLFAEADADEPRALVQLHVAVP
jgi:hypothetical protein